MIPDGCFDFEFNGEDCRTKFGVYMIYNNLDHSKYYVGSTSNSFHIRWKGHRSNFNKNNNNTYMQRIYNKHGENVFSFIILEICLIKENAVICEQKWINMINPSYNLSPIAGSALGVKHTVEHKMKNSERRIKWYLDGNIHPSLGKPMSMESKQKSSTSHKEFLLTDKGKVQLISRSLINSQRKGETRRKHTQEEIDKIKVAVNMANERRGYGPRKGQPMSDITKLKLSASKKNPSAETREKMRIAQIGKTPWNKGKKGQTPSNKKVIDMLKILALKKQGLSYTKISKLLNVTRTSIRNRLNDKLTYADDFKEVSNG